MKIYRTTLGYSIHHSNTVVYADKKGIYDGGDAIGKMIGSLNIRNDPEISINELPKDVAGEVLKAIYWRMK